MSRNDVVSARREFVIEPFTRSAGNLGKSEFLLETDAKSRALAFKGTA